MKKIFLLVFVVTLVIICSSCQPKTYEIAMITDVGSIDDKSFNQGTWEGVKKYGEEFNISHKYYKPREKSTQAYLDTIDLAVKGGAKVIVTAGYLFENAIYQSQDKYKDVKFILIDGAPNNLVFNDAGDLVSGEERIEDNVYSIFYAEHESGFLAGYAAVKDGFRNLGFMGGMALPSVVKFGYGFVQGAEYAANELGLDDGAVKIRYHYLGGFEANPDYQTMAASWYADGIDVIFVAAGGAGSSIMKAAEVVNNKYVIGVDVDQSGESTVVITSAIKKLSTSVYQCLSVIYDENSQYKNLFKTKQKTVLDATNDGVGLPEDLSRFPNKAFTASDYNRIYNSLKNDEVTIISEQVPANQDLETYLGLKKVDITEIA
ncbi:MAG TPA: BMP family ABC transporter substrate-binding protein [Haloplasmataceae bacterium]